MYDRRFDSRTFSATIHTMDRHLNSQGYRQLSARGFLVGIRSRDSLTERQTEIAELVLVGKSSREIAAQLSLSPRTVETHIGAIFNKLGVRSRVELVTSLFRLEAEGDAGHAGRGANTNPARQRTRPGGRQRERRDVVQLLNDDRS
jgi:DNA-binding CsgD family transcriptional regulator